MRKQTLAIIILVVLLVVAVGYILYGTYRANEQKKLMAAAQVGYEQAVIDLMQKAATCQAVPLYAGNTTISVVAVECLTLPSEESSNRTQ